MSKNYQKVQNRAKNTKKYTSEALLYGVTWQKQPHRPLFEVPVVPTHMLRSAFHLLQA